MSKVNWALSNATPNFILPVTLVAGAAAAVVATLDVRAVNQMTMSIDVSVAALTGLQVYARSDVNAKWVPIATVAVDYTSVSGLALSVRSDGAADLTTTPAGVTATFGISTAFWSDIQVLAASAGNAVLSITAGRKQ